MPLLYILQSESNHRFYIGSTTDLGRRLAEHARNETPSTRNRGPWRLVYQEAYPTLNAARQRERQLKAWKSHKAIANFVVSSNSAG